MNKIIFPQELGQQGPAVGDLQDALLALLERAAILPNDPSARRDLAAELNQERLGGTYGPITNKLVSIFQDEHGLTAHGAVDEKTAAAFNGLLSELGLLEKPAAPLAFVVSGQVRREDGRPMPNTAVRAFQAARQAAIRLGEDVTDSEGRYTVRYEPLPGEEFVHLRVSAIDNEGQTLDTSEIRENAGVVEIIDLTVPARLPGPGRTITGRVLLEDRRPAENLTLRLYRMDYGGVKRLLSETKTVPGGGYAFHFDPDSANANLHIVAVRPTGAEVPLQAQLNYLNGAASVTRNLVAPLDLAAPPEPEFRRLAADLRPHVGELSGLVGACETPERQDVTALNRATGWDARSLALAIQAARLSANPQSTASAEGYYGLLRAGLPSDQVLLAQVSEEVVTATLKTMREAGIIGLTDPQMEEFQNEFRRFSTSVRLSLPVPGSNTNYGGMLDATNLSTASKTAFASVYFHHTGTDAQLWQKAREKGLSDQEIGELQRQGVLSFITSGSQEMTAWLMRGTSGQAAPLSDPAQLADRGLYTAEQWEKELDEAAALAQKPRDALIPSAYTGQPDQQRKTYLEDLARKVRISFPTHVLAHEIAASPEDDFDLGEARTPTARLLRNAAGQGFRLGQTPVRDFFNTHPGASDGLSPQAFEAAQEAVLDLQRTYQISTSNRVMKEMRRAGLRSAGDVTALTREDFRAHYGRLFSSEKEADLVYRKAEQVTSTVNTVLAMASRIQSDVDVFAASAPAGVQRSVKDALIKHFPNFETLFGAQDFCDCEHCRSVLSPAAYLVDLLQFVEAEESTRITFEKQWDIQHNEPYTARFKRPFDALTERRPDLIHIPLTCENTNTALPYIDLVNEILEYFVAKGQLDEGAARDTGGATTDELLAEPQNVIREAYDVVRAARYPLTLPFDLWLEMVRQFAGQFDTPLAGMLEAFRPGLALFQPEEKLFDPAQPFDWAAIFIETLGLSPAEFALFTDKTLLTNGSWYELYGYSTTGPEIADASNTTPSAALTLPNDNFSFEAGDPVTYRRDGKVNGETLTIAETGAPDSGGTGRRLIRLDGVWGTPPASGDELIAAAPALLKSARTLADRLGVTYQELVEIIQTGFVNPQLVALALLYKLGLTVSDVFFYQSHKTFHQQNQDLLDKEREELSAADQARFDALAIRDPVTRRTGREDLEQAHEIHMRLSKASEEFAPFNATQWVEETFISGAFNNVLVLSDPDAGCSFDATTLRYADGRAAEDTDFLRINLLVRVWRKLGWTIEETDRALTSFTPSSPSADEDLGLGTLLIYLAHLKTLLEKLPVGKDARRKLLTFWSDLATTGAKPLYAQLFLTRSVLKNDPVFDHPLGLYLSDESVFLKDHLLALQGALGLTADEIERTLVHAGQTLDEARLTLSNVSLLYRYRLMAKGLKLSVHELIALQQLSGLDPFTPLQANPPEKLAEDHPFSQTLRLVEIAKTVKDSGLKIEDLEYLLRHRFDPTGKYRQDAAETLRLLRTLAEGIRAIRAEHAVPNDPAALSDETLRQKLGLVLPADAAGRLLAMLNGTLEFTAVTSAAENAQLKPATFAIEPSIVAVSFNPVRQEQKLTFRGVLFLDAQAALEDQFQDSLSPEQQEIFTRLLNGVREDAQAFFDKHLLKQAEGSLPAYGFLKGEDYRLLFDRSLPVVSGETAEERERREQERFSQQRRRLIDAFLPFLQANLVRQFILQTLVAHTGAEPRIVESLLTDARLLGISEASGKRPLLDAFIRLGERGIDARFFDSDDLSGNPQASAPVVASADTALKNNGLNPAGSARFAGYLEVPAAGDYRFFVVLEKQGAQVDLRFDHLPQPVFLEGIAPSDGHILEDFLALRPGQPYRFTLEIQSLNGGRARLLVQGETLPKDRLGQLALYPFSALEDAERSLLVLCKALQLVQAFGLSERETRYLLTHAADFADIDLSQLPADAADDTPGKAQMLFRPFLRLAQYARLKRDLALDTDDLINVFEAQQAGGAEAVYSIFARVARREAATVKAAAEALALTPAFPSEEPVLRLWEALQIVERFGVPPASLLKWTRIVRPEDTPEQRELRFAIARDVKETIKSRFEPEAWQSVAKPIFDRLRQHQRDALTAHVMHALGLESEEQLYEFFLVDPGMEPVVETSRIRLAIASVQLFIQRCLLNLEEKVHPSAIRNAPHWEWMKRYRVWEANRKIFLYPENFLEPEFRDDKTPLFTDLESELLQGDVSSDLVEDAFLNYLRKLAELARLNLVAMHLEQRDEPGQNVLHVFGRTFSQPHKYFYRCYASGRWSPWQPVPAEIEGDHLAPVVWEGRLWLFWVTFLEKPKINPRGISIDPKKQEAVNIDPPASFLEAHLNWSEYVNGVWGTRETGAVDPSEAIIVENLDLSRIKEIFVHVSKEVVNGEEGGVFIHLVPPGNTNAFLARKNCPGPGNCVDPLEDNDGGIVADPATEADPTGTPTTRPPGSPIAFYLAGRNSSPEKKAGKAAPANPYSNAGRPHANRYRGGSAVTVKFTQRITIEPGKLPQPFVASSTIMGRPQSGGYYLLPSDNRLDLEVPEAAYTGLTNADQVKAALENSLAELESLMKPVFYQDNTHTFFIEPQVAEHTIEQWEGWVQPTLPTHTFDLSELKEWQKQHVQPHDPRSVQPGQSFDWLMNTGTLVRFDDTVIGPLGQIPLTFEQAAQAAAGRGVAVRVNSASAAEPADMAILGEGLTLEQVGLAQPAGGLRVVGAGGVNEAIMNNLDQARPNGSGAGSLER